MTDAPVWEGLHHEPVVGPDGIPTGKVRTSYVKVWADGRRLSVPAECTCARGLDRCTCREELVWR